MNPHNARANLRRACTTSIRPPTSRAPAASAGCWAASLYDLKADRIGSIQFT